MNARRVSLPLAAAMSALAVELILAGQPLARGQHPTNTITDRDPTGKITTFTTNGFFDTRNPFFQSLGTNGRACLTCHQPQDGWSVSAQHVRERFEQTGGLDPLFRLNDGSNSPNADFSTVQARRAACSMLLNKGLIRVGIGIPANAEFELAEVDDPYGYASAKELSLFRRPLPSTNLRFLSAVMWDGRETIHPMKIQPLGGNEDSNVEALFIDLMHQSNDATIGHAQAAHDLTDDQKAQIVSFEIGLNTAQSFDAQAGDLRVRGGRGGPLLLAQQPFYIGINDNVADPHGPFDPVAMRLYDAWADAGNPHRAAVARGQALFNTKQITITGVKGLNDNPYFGSPPVVVGTCTTCHNTPNVGNHSLAVPLDIGLTDASRRTADMPLYTLRNKATGEAVQTTDPGRALISGKWKDIGKFKGPILRGLAARAPYFHNGSAASLADAVEFYDKRFGIHFTQQEKEDLVAFLQSL